MPYENFCKAFKPIIPKLAKQIKQSPTNSILIPARYIAEDMGSEYKDKPPIVILWGAKYCLKDTTIIIHGEKGTGNIILEKRKHRVFKGAHGRPSGLPIKKDVRSISEYQTYLTERREQGYK